MTRPLDTCHAAEADALLPADVGLASQLYWGLSLSRALELLARRTRLVQIYSAGLHSLLIPESTRAIRASGLQVTVHGPGGAGLDLGSTHELMRRFTVEVHRRHAEAAAEADALCYVVHPDSSPDPCDVSVEAMSALRRSLAELEEVQRMTGVRIAIENMPSQVATRFSAPGQLDLGGLGLALDCGHAALSGTLADFLASPRAQVVHVHLHSNHGPVDAGDPHRPLGIGVVNPEPVLALARAVGITTILEHDDEPSVTQSISYLRSLGLA